MLGVLLGVVMGRLCLCVWCGLCSRFEALKICDLPEKKSPISPFSYKAISKSVLITHQDYISILSMG